MKISKYPPKEDLKLRWEKVQTFMKEAGADACIASTNVNIYYLTGKIFAGYVYLPSEGEPIEFVQRPNSLEGERIIPIRKPEDIPALLSGKGYQLPSVFLLEADQITYNEYLRLEKALAPGTASNATPVLRKARMTKTPWEIEQLRISGTRHAEAYKSIPSLFRSGMRDIEFQYEIEWVMRQNGSLGIFRTFGHQMEIFMGSLLAGKNAATPSSYDFALGGGGMSACLPIGASGDIIEKGQSIMIDMAGNFTAYMTDMTRVYSYGTLPDKAYRAHEASIQMHNRLLETAKPGTECAEIYNWSLEMAEEAGFAANFMGTVQQAKFTGHGVGLEINEPPVLMGRSKDTLQPGMTIAFEPKFVLPDIGAVGIENTFLITENGIEKITVFEENIMKLE
ncbi:MAG: Xaa-Pro peptidase family protein [Bacteroidales bacterium]|nr:Xaa-Pro peptidase family protein [Bacteroidales bacterium]